MVTTSGDAIPTNEPAAVVAAEEAEVAYRRVTPDAEALTTRELTALNVDVVEATSTILGVAPRILGYRPRIERLPEFDLRHVDALTDRASAALFVSVTNFPVPEPEGFEKHLAECVALRRKLLTWAVPLVDEGVFDRAAIAKIKAGSGFKDAPSDVIGLVGLYRSRWSEIENMTGVTEAELTRGAALGPAVFAMVARRENQTSFTRREAALRVRRFWTLADRSYRECQRAVAYLERDPARVAAAVPSLRKNQGPRPKRAPEPVAEPVAEAGTVPADGVEEPPRPEPV